MKKAFALVLALIMLLALCSCGGAKEPEAPAEPVETAPVETPAPKPEPVKTPEPEKPAEPEKPENTFNEQGKVLVDNEYITITLEDQFDESYSVGYTLTLENKSDKYLLINIENGCIDGFMTYLNLENGSISPNKKAKAKLCVYTGDSGINSLDDLKNVEGTFSFFYNDDGSNSYSMLDTTADFFIEGNANGGIQQEASKTSVEILNSDGLIITLGDKFEEDYSVGYKLTIENTTDKHLLVNIENSSVDGFMTYLNLDNGSVAPNKKANAKMTVYTADSDIKTVDDLKNVEGTFTVWYNSDGSNSYSDFGSYPFFIGEDTVSASAAAPAAQAPAASSTPVLDNKTKTIAIGETISTDSYDFTLNNVEITYEVKPRNTNSFYTSYTAEDGKVYIHIDADYLNKSKKDVCIRDLPEPAADYDDGFSYTGFPIVDDGDNGFDWVSSYVVAPPLSTCHYHGLVECPELIYESDAPLFVTLKMTDGTMYRYDIR